MMKFTTRKFHKRTTVELENSMFREIMDQQIGDRKDPNAEVPTMTKSNPPIIKRSFGRAKRTEVIMQSVIE